MTPLRPSLPIALCTFYDRCHGDQSDLVANGGKTNGAIYTNHLGEIMALTKSDIVSRVNELGFTQKQSTDVVESLLEIIKNCLEGGEDVLVSGFGKFCVKEKRPRRGRNPATGEDLMLDGRKVVTFKCSGKLREKIN